MSQGPLEACEFQIYERINNTKIFGFGDSV